jgi:tRNA uridine 5-carbamoylmethylation protein Kti12
MKLIFIYGPPAVGKLTVARELSKMTGYRVFHNHLTVDLAASILGMPTNPENREEFMDLVDRYRLELMELAAKKRLGGLITTFVYAADVKRDDEFVRKTIRMIKRRKGEVCFVQLHSDPGVLRRRLSARSRGDYGKIKDARILDDILSKHDIFSPIGFVKSFRIDTTKISARRAAEMIRKEYGL